MVREAMKRICRYLLGIAFLALPGCHTMRFNIADAPAGEVVTEHKSFFLWGLAPTKRVDVREKCPYGVASITEETNFLDGLGNLFTLGIWSPRSTYYTCRPVPGM